MSDFGATLTELYQTIIRPVEDFLANNRIFVNVLIVLLLLYFVITLFREDVNRNRFTVWMGIFAVALGFLYGEGLIYKVAAIEAQMDNHIIDFADESASAVASLIDEMDALLADGYILAEDETEYEFTGDADTPIGYIVVTQVKVTTVYDDPYPEAGAIGEARPAQVLKCFGVDHNNFKNTTWYLVETDSGDKGYLPDGSGRLFVREEAAEPEKTEEPALPEATEKPA